MQDLWITVIGVAIGAILGAAILPWKDRVFGEQISNTQHMMIWACAWPFLILWLSKDFIKNALRKW